MTKVTIAFIGTRRYFSFFGEFYASCMKLLLVNCHRQFLVFTDSIETREWPRNCTFYPIEHQPWPLITLKRFEILLKAEQAIRQADWFIYLDADMLVTAKLTEADLFSSKYPLFGVQHPAFYGTSAGTFESNPRSSAYVPASADKSTYWQGCLWGGRTEYVISMIKTLYRRIQEDLAEGVIAVWHDESHLNKFFIDNRPLVKTLDPSFAFPACRPIALFERKIVHLEKDDDEYWFA
jgi:Glycosyltransferase family 6